MAKVFKQKELIFNQKNAPIPEFVWHATTNLADIVGSKHLQFNVKSLDPGKYSYPYHFHRNAEELFVILSGSATLRTPDGFEEINEGDIIFFEVGASGAHQVYNHTNEPCKYLDIRTFNEIDICEYPDTGKINILPYQEIFQTEDKVSYFKGEENPGENWPIEMRNKKIETENLRKIYK